MRRFKRYVKQIALALVITLLVPILSPAAEVSAEETESTRVLEIGANAYLEYEETDTVRTAIYYENGVALQRAEYYLDTGVILYYDLSQKTRNDSLQNIDESRENAVIYHINDFKKVPNNEYDQTSTRDLNGLVNMYDNLNSRATNYTCLKSKTLVFDGEEYVRLLYGRTGSREYLEDYWYFEAKVAISVVLATIGFFVPDLENFLRGLSTAAGELIDAIAIEDWILEYYWVYKFVQALPTRIEFECPYQFPYLKYRRIDTTEGNVGGWDYDNPVYQKTSAEIEAERDEILTSPALYQ